MSKFLIIGVAVSFVCFALGYVFINAKCKKAQRLSTFLWNKRIDMLQKPPYSHFLNVYERKNYFLSLLFVIVCNAPAHIILFSLGLIKIGVIFALIQAFMQGCVVGMGERKTRIFGIITAVFEVSGFAVSAWIGLFFAYHLWWLSALLLLLNAIVEATGTFFNITGVPGIEVVRNKAYRNQDH